MNTDYQESRVFITTSNKAKYHQVFKFIQKKSDGSIYVIFIPDFKGKYSFHATGQTHYKTYEKPGEPLQVLMGSPLLDFAKNEIGVKHLFSVQLMKPSFEPEKPFSKVKSDYCIMTMHKTLQPTSLIFFAIPKQSHEFGFSFPTDTICPRYLGVHAFPLYYHNIFWVAYSSDYQKTWFEKNVIHLSDGYFVPVPVVLEENEMTKRKKVNVRYVRPQYGLTGNNKATISLIEKEPPNSLSKWIIIVLCILGGALLMGFLSFSLLKYLLK
jgi:hypothetical protein